MCAVGYLGTYFSKPLDRKQPYASMPITFVKLKRRLNPWDLPNSLRRGPSRASSSSPDSSCCTFLLCSLTLWVQGNNQNRLRHPLTDAAASDTNGPIWRGIGAVRPKIKGEKDCIWKKYGKTVCCNVENPSLSRLLKANGEATYE